ncbi:uncharacterized protein (DUF849 family) [Rubricella aquisinus]|uniref:Uncharacterized protein (DUF849 family) n=1 Tax=Rubricella aquisinus TaxID=2028108 RepID=A0A840X1S0_9RHOB|nr:3-keto-5-aminohexanoate cleavage protein [Rubricella aquisinus]MBB5515835.1 uncharacterized protein (DUF849 family) [Rubricella aquisinus]
MVQACLNGARSRAEHLALPLSPAELVRDAIAAREAGATSLHIHPRDANGLESLLPDVIGAALEAVRDACPDLPIGVSTGAWIAPTGDRRLDAIAGWQALPDFASVNLGEADAPTVMDALLDKGIGIEAGIWTHADAQRFCTLRSADAALRILVEIPDCPGPVAKADAARIIAYLEDHGPNVPILLHGAGHSAWPMVMEAVTRGLATRVGLEDMLTLPGGDMAQDNAALIRCALDLGAS